MEKQNSIKVSIIVCALGYFIDIFDLYLFAILRVSSLTDLGLTTEEITQKGLLLLNMQMAGLLFGGILWGVLGDKRGRLSVLFGSIFLYSICNILNAFVTSVPQYAVLRFFAGVGLAGELGAAVTLVSELLPKEKRGIGATIIASVGLSGSVAAAMTAKFFSWQICYIIGGVLGLLLLVLRFKMHESLLFEVTRAQSVSRGNFFSLFTNWGRFKRYVNLILVGVPVWFVAGILVSFSPEFALALGIQGHVTAGDAVFYTYIGVALGDLLTGLLSQWFKNRKIILAIFLGIVAILIGLYLKSAGVGLIYFYFVCFLLGVGTGYWAVLMVTAAEQFGTNLRATVTTTIPNFIRGSVVPVSILFQYFKQDYGIIQSAAIVGVIVTGLGFWALYNIRESFFDDLNFLEED